MSNQNEQNIVREGVNTSLYGREIKTLWNEFHYIRPTHSEVDMAEQAPPDDSNSGRDSTMVLRPKPDAPLEVEKKRIRCGSKVEKIAFFTYSS